MFQNIDRNLEISLVSAALAFFCSYGIRQRIREGYTQLKWIPLTRQDNPAQFWTLMLILGLIDAAFVGLAVTYFFRWLGQFQMAF